jgi:CubicO group peptidase (beta-lactamase class C family)
MNRTWGLIALVASLLAIAPADADVSSDPIEGFWLSDTPMPRASGELSIELVNKNWMGRFGGVKATHPVETSTIELNFPGNLGSFRGTYSGAKKQLEGFWVHEGDQGQRLAMPVRLQKGSGNIWHGPVAPLDLRFTLYLRIFKREDGALIAAFRNPQRNTRGGASRLFVKRTGDKVLFLERDDGKPRDDGHPSIVHTARYLEAQNAIEMPWPETGQSVRLTQKDAAEVPGYFPRDPTATAYRYDAPEASNDGWKVAPAKDVGFDENALSKLIQKIAASDPAERQPNLIHSLLISRNGKLVLEEYFYGHRRDSLHDMRSAGKTFNSVMLGATIMNGEKLSPSSKITSILSAIGPFANPAIDKDRITLAHLMTHTSGLDCNDNDATSPGSEDTMQSQNTQGDWWKYTLDLPLKSPPGSRYAYCSAGMNLVGGALTSATKTWLPMLFDRQIAQPLQFEQYVWNLAPNGEGYAAGGSRLRSRDLLKIGQVFLDGGTWNGKQIVSPQWIKQSTAPLVEINETNTGLDAETLRNTYAGGADGYAWHTFNVVVGNRTYREFEAAGNGGQILMVIPELNLAVVFTGGNYNQGFIWGRWRDEIVAGLIIPAISSIH